MVRLTRPDTAIVAVTTTPVPAASVNPPRYNSDVIARNKLALAAMRDVVPASRLTITYLYDWVVAKCGEGYSTCPIQLPSEAACWYWLAFCNAHIIGGIPS